MFLLYNKDMLNDNFESVLRSIPQNNPFGEKITVVGAVKTVCPEDVSRAVAYGLENVGENKVQEFISKYPFYPPCKLHFIGHLQTNKVKYIIGKVSLIQSCDSKKLAEKISDAAVSAGIIQDVLIEVNVGKEKQKSGFIPEDLPAALNDIQNLKGLRIKGLMTVLPSRNSLFQMSGEKKVCEKEAADPVNDKLSKLCLHMRELYDTIKKRNADIDTLSMGMSADYKIAVACGSNMLRLGSLLFGKRNYDTGAKDDV